MPASGRSAERIGLKIPRRFVQVAFLALFVFLTVSAAYPPTSTPPANFLLRFDPLAGLSSFAATRTADVLVSYWPAWILLGLTLLSYRFFCAWLCPLGTCFDLAGDLKPEQMEYYKPRGKDLRAAVDSSDMRARVRKIRLKYVILVVVLALALAGVNLLYIFSPLTVFNRSIYFILVPQLPVLLLILLLLAFIYRPRFWCEEICPLGALFSLFSLAGRKIAARFRPITVTKDTPACISCGACYRECSFGVSEPYTSEESGPLQAADCTACGDCVTACPAPGALELDSFGVTLYKSRGETASPVVPVGASTATDSEDETVDRRLTVTRKEFVASLGVGAVLLAGYGIGLKDLEEPLLRMPGAQDESAFLAACARCGECTRACPTGCIRPMGLDGGFQKLWTPRFEPRRACCTFDQCGQACAGVCPSNAIESQKPEVVRIGTAHVNQYTCLAFRGGVCLVCKEKCRFNAIQADSSRRPVVNVDACTGCGSCQMDCPTDIASIQVLPMGHEPDWKSGGSSSSFRLRGGRG